MSEQPTPTPTPTPTSKHQFSRDEIRQAFLDAKPKSQSLTVFGVEVFLKEPPLGVVLDTEAAEDRKVAMVTMIVKYVHTEDGTPVFDESDIDGLLGVPFSADMRTLSEAISKMTGVSPTTEDKSPAPA